MDSDFDLSDYADAPQWLKDTAGSTENLLGRMRRARNKGLATEQDVEDARRARDLVRYICKRASWRHSDGHNQ